jgi:hypothetical protein
MHEISVHHLTSRQLHNLSKGKGVRVSHGNGHIFHVDTKLYNKFHRNSRLGKQTTLKKGAGLLSDVYNYVKRNPVLRGMANRMISSGKHYAHIGTDYLAHKAHSKINEFPLIEGSGMRHHHHHHHGHHSHHSHHGRGLGGLVLNGAGELAGAIGGPGSGEAKAVLQTLGGIGSFLGLGMKHKSHHHHSHHHKKRASPAQLAALARGRAKRHHNLHGGALMPAGY